MSVKIFDIFNNIILKLKISFKRFPEVLFVSIMIVIIGIMLNHEPNFTDEILERFEKIMMILCLSVPLSAYGKLLYENGKKVRVVTDIVVVFTLFIIYLTIPSPINNQFMIRFAILIVSSILAFTLINYYNTKNYSIYILKLISNFFITLLYSIILYLGIISIIFTVEKLFELSINQEIYFDVFIIICGLFSITYFFAILPKSKNIIELIEYPFVLKKLLFFIIIPLLTIYTMILYLYFGRIIILKEFPINLLGHLVLWYGFISTIAMFFINKVNQENKFIMKFYKYFPVAIMVPLFMLFLAIFKRISNYSITPPRYFVIILGLWIFGCMVYIFFSKKFKSNFLVIAAICLLLISIYGPFSSFSLSKKFPKDSVFRNMIENGEIIKNNEISDINKKEISNFINYFDEFHEFKDIKILPEDFEISSMEEVFGFKNFDYYGSSYNAIRYYNNYEDYVIDISGYTYVANVNLNLDESKKIQNDKIEIKYESKDKKIIVLQENIQIADVLVEDLINDYHKKQKGRSIETINEAIIEYDFDLVKLKFIIKNVYYDESRFNNYLEFQLFLDIIM